MILLLFPGGLKCNLKTLETIKPCIAECGNWYGYTQKLNSVNERKDALSKMKRAISNYISKLVQRAKNKPENPDI